MLKRRKESDNYLAINRRHHWSRLITMKIDKILELSVSTVAIYFHCDLCTPAMSTDSSQVGVALFPSF